MSIGKKTKKWMGWALGLFALLLVFRLAYGYIKYPNGSAIPQTNNNTSFERSPGFLNIASSKYEYKKATANRPVVQVDQKFEKTANLNCRSNTFEDDEKTIRKTIEEKNAIIQFQQKSGNPGNQQLKLQIGVPPLAFDAFIEAIKASQQVTAISLTKKDKTNEYRELNSKMNTLTKTRNSLVELKNKGGKIEEYINLENRILEIDEQLQNLGVQLGNFDSENEFCTVNISLQEGKTNEIGFMQRIKVAFEWTVKYYFLLMISLFFALGAAYILVLTLERLKGFTNGG